VTPWTGYPRGRADRAPRYLGRAATEPHRAATVRNMGLTLTELAPPGSRVSRLYFLRGGTGQVYFHVYLLRAASFVQSTDLPLFAVPVPSNSDADMRFDPPLDCPEGLHVACSDDSAFGNAGGTPHSVTAFLLPDAPTRGPDAPEEPDRAHEAPALVGAGLVEPAGRRGWRWF
jgi:hypothetical protein